MKQVQKNLNVDIWFFILISCGFFFFFLNLNLAFILQSNIFLYGYRVHQKDFILVKPLE